MRRRYYLLGWTGARGFAKVCARSRRKIVIREERERKRKRARRSVEEGSEKERKSMAETRSRRGVHERTSYGLTTVGRCQLLKLIVQNEMQAFTSVVVPWTKVGQGKMYT